MDEPVVISFYTSEEHKEYAERLIEICKNLNLDFCVEHHDSDFDKSFFIRSCLQKFQRPVLWVDIDGCLLNHPSLGGLGTDFAACEMDSQWRQNILWFNYTLPALDFLDEWCLRTSDASFNDVYKEFKGRVIPCILPNEYHFIKSKSETTVPVGTIFYTEPVSDKLL